MTTRTHRTLRAADLLGPAADAPTLRKDASPIDRIRESGLVGCGGAGFPTWRKISSGAQAGCSVVIANGAECEPLLVHNVARMETDAARVLARLTEAKRLVGAERAIVAIKPKNAAAVRALHAALDDAAEGRDGPGIDPGIEVAFLQDRYPAGDERAIVRDVLGTLLPPDALPSEAGAVVLNVETLLRIHEVLSSGRAVRTKDITVAGRLDGSGVPDTVSLALLDVPIGTSVRAVLDALHVTPAPDSRILLGGPYMGRAATPDDVVDGACGGIVVTGPELPDPGPLGIILCACGASEDRLQATAEAMGAAVTDVRPCKNAVRLPSGRLRCRNPGICPGQAENVLALRREGAQGVLISHCTDCTNTVMQIAPRLGMRVHHVTDAALRAAGEPLIRVWRRTGR